MDKRFAGLKLLLCGLLFTVAASAGLLDKLDQLGGAAKQQDFLPPEQAFVFSHETYEQQRLPLVWTVAEGYYLYRDKLKFESPDGSAVIGKPQFPPAEEKQDEAFGRVAIYKHELKLALPVTPAAGASKVQLKITYQGCAEDGICYPPIHQTLSLPVAAVSAAPAPLALEPPGGRAAESLDADRLSTLLANSGLPVIAATFFGFGLLLALTPCVFPMVPILSSIVVGERGPAGAGRGLLLSVVYVLAMAATYAAVGLTAGLFGRNVQAAFQHPVVLVAFSALFVALALSMFGFFHLQLPQALRQRLERSHQGSRGGSLAGVALMGVLSAVIVGPCVAPPLAGALLYLAHEGSPVVGGVALFALGLGMGVPLLIVGASAGHFLPRAGAWLERVQHVFGVVSLGMAIWFLGRVLPPTLTLALWSLLLIGTGIFLRALEPLPELASGWQRLWKGLGLALVTYGGVLIVGAAAGADDLLKPLAPFTSASENQSLERKQAFTTVKSAAALEAAIQQASAAGQPVLLDFYADWCVECKRLERETFGDPRVAQRLAGFTLLRADVTANDETDRALMAGLSLFGPPAVLLYDPAGQERRDQRLIGFAGPAEFLARLAALGAP